MLPRQKRRGGGGGQAANKIVNAVYHKLTELVETMAILLETQPLTDTTVLLVCMEYHIRSTTLHCSIYLRMQLSSMGTLPFFVENVSLLQLSALRLVRAVCMHVIASAVSSMYDPSSFNICWSLCRSLHAMISIVTLFWRRYLPLYKDCQPTREI